MFRQATKDREDNAKAKHGKWKIIPLFFLHITINRQGEKIKKDETILCLSNTKR
jgi:hypothetical protein